MKYMPKKDCFAYDDNHFDCKALTELFCIKERCKFYKTIKQNKEEESK